jgi:hypothetical protein
MVKLAEARARLARLEAGGAPDRPIEVTSASVVEIHGAALECTGCGADGTRVEEHVAITVSGREGGLQEGESRTLRVARTRCPRCGVRRDVYFRLGTPLPS